MRKPLVLAMAEKTEPPTRRRLRQALAEGDSPLSTMLAGTAGLLAVVAVLPWALDSFVATIFHWLDRALDPNSRAVEPLALLETTVGWLGALVATAAVPALVASLIQTGGVVTASRRQPARPQPAVERAFEAARALGLTVALIAVAGLVLWSHRLDIAKAAGRLDASLELVRVAGLRALYWGTALVLAVAMIDRVASGVFWIRRNRMSRHERMVEQRESEGDPEIRRRRRHAHETLAREAPLAAVAQSTVVVAGEGSTAVALIYDDAASGAPPLVLAIGRGFEARRIIERAQRARVPVVERPELAEALASGSSGQAIARAHYDAVADLLAMLTPRPT